MLTTQALPERSNRITPLPVVLVSNEHVPRWIGKDGGEPSVYRAHSDRAGVVSPFQNVQRVTVDRTPLASS